MSGPLLWALVALGGAAGAAARYAVHHALRTRWGATSTASTLVVNVAGSFVLGMLVAQSEEGGAMALLGIGVCGAFTTFSTLALDLWSAIDEGHPRRAAVNAVLSLALGLGAAYLGMLLTS